MKKRILLISCSVLLAICCVIGMSLSVAADEPITVLDAEFGELGGNAAVHGFKVGNLGKCGGDIEGTVTFMDIEVPESGKYALLVYYCSGSDDRYFDITTDKGTYKLDCPYTGGFDTVGAIVIEVELEAGGFMTFGSDWYGPDLDMVEIYRPEDMDFIDKNYPNPYEYLWNDILSLDLNNGVYSIYSGEDRVLSNARAELIIDGVTVSSDDFANHDIEENGDSISFIHTNNPDFAGELVQVFYYKKGGYIMTEFYATSYADEISTNYMSPMSVYQNSIRIEDCVFLQMPFDNDKWVEPKFIAEKDLLRTTYGYEVGVFYNSTNSDGLVMGSVIHDTWKTGICVYSDEGKIQGVDLYGGAADSNTRDTAPHGYISSEHVTSPMIFIGFFDNWQEGLTAFGKANCEFFPANQYNSYKTPLGFNSWGSLGTGVKHSDMLKVSSYIKNNLQEIWDNGDATVYVNIDSYWDYLVENDPSCDLTLDQALAAFVKCCKDNGQKPGIYYTPFACWLPDENAMKNTKMEGSDYTYYDAAMRNADGTGIYGKLAGGYALDPTHPGTQARIKDRMNYFINLGFEYIKLDFMTHGAVEGKHYDESVKTGMQAYNMGMQKLYALCNGRMFVNLSISPVFPYEYANGRRISCDAFASIDNTQHVLSYLSACFWHKEIYQYPDPDHILVLGSSEGAARCRVTSGVISGTSFLVGDNLSNVSIGSSDHKMIMKMYGNKDVISVAKLGKAFAPLTMSAGQRCADAYWCEVDGVLYFAVFNFGQSGKTSYDLSSIVKSVPQGAVATELWRGSKTQLEGSTLVCDLASEDAAIYKIELKNGGGADTQTPDSTQTTPTETQTPQTNAPSTQQPGNSTVIIFAVIAVVVVVAGAIVAVVLIKKRSAK